MKKEIKILLLEDNRADADLILRQLKKSGMVFLSKIVETRKMYEEALDAFSPDIVLSDYSLPAFDGASAFRILKSREFPVPFIVVSGTIGEENAVKLIKEGVTDYASKSNLAVLPQKVIRAINEAAEILEKQQILQKLKAQTETLLLANEELVYQNEEKEKRAVELQNANKELLAFNFISSHDLQEPLRKIQIFASKLRDNELENLTESGKRNLERIQFATTRMRRLIDDLLAFSRMTNNDRNYQFTDLHAILDDVTLELKDTIEEKQARIEATGLLPASIVVFQFRQLVYNLISNALKFSLPEVPPHIIIETQIVKRSNAALREQHSLTQNCDYWNISFKDNGMGFDPQFSERIFVMFQRLHTVQDHVGTGIGLAIVKKIVDNHDGIVLATGALNKGATFDIFLPVSQKPDKNIKNPMLANQA